MKKKVSVKKNFVMSLIKTLMGLIFPLITFPYASRVLLVDGIGKVNYVLSIISYFQMIAALGISTYAVTEGSKIRDDQEKLNRFSSEVFTINIISTIISYLLFLIFIRFSIFENYRQLLLLGSLSIMFTTIGVEWIYMIHEDYQYITIRSIVFQALSLILLVLLVKDETDLVQYLLLSVISSVGSGLINFIGSKKYIKLRILKPDFKILSRHLKPILLIFGMSVSTTIYSNSDIFLLGVLKGDNAVGLYSTAVKLNQIIIALICSVNNVLLPRLSYYVKNEMEIEYQSLIKKAVNMIVFFAIPMSIGLIILSDVAVLMIAGSEFLKASYIVKILAFNIILSPLNNFLAYQILMPFRRENVSFRATMIAAGINIVGNIILIPFMSYIGAALTTILAEVFVFIICLKNVSDKIDWKKLFSKVYQYILSSIPIIVICYLLGIFIDNIYLYALLCIPISAIIYFVLLILFKNELILEGISLVKGIIKKKVYEK